MEINDSPGFKPRAIERHTPQRFEICNLEPVFWDLHPLAKLTALIQNIILNSIPNSSLSKFSLYF